MNNITRKSLKIGIALLAIALAGSLYIYKCYTDPYYFKSELYENNRFKRCEVLSKYIPDGSTREHVEKILVESDGAKIRPNNPNSKGPEIGSVIYDLDPWAIFATDAAILYIWYDNNNKVIGLAGTRCLTNRYPPLQQKIHDDITKGVN